MNNTNQKYITKAQLKTVINSNPSLDKEKIFDEFLNSGYIVEGYNDQNYTPPKQNLTQRVSNSWGERSGKVKSSWEDVNKTIESENTTAMQRISEGLPKLGKALLDTAGNVVGGVGDLANEAFTSADDTLFNGKVSEKIGEVASPVVAPIMQKVDEYAPEGTKTRDVINDVANIATAIPMVKILGTGAKKAGKTVTEIAEKQAVKTAEKTAEKSLKQALESITPKTSELTPTEYETLLKQQKITPRTSSAEPTYILSDAEKGMATKYKDILQYKDPVKNSIKVIDKIYNTDTEVGAFLKKNNGIFNNGELKNYIKTKLEPITDLTVDETRLAKLKESTIDNFINGLPKNNMESLWKARKTFDQQIQNAFSGAPNLTKSIQKEFRDAVQNFIADKTPDGVYKAKMKDMSELFNLHEVIATKAGKEKALNAAQLWLKQHPKTKKAAEIGASAAGGGFILNWLLN